MGILLEMYVWHLHLSMLDIKIIFFYNTMVDAYAAKNGQTFHNQYTMFATKM